MSECMTPFCGGRLYSRGVCRACYSAAILRVNSGLTTWKELEELGLVKPNKRASAFTGAFNEAFNEKLESKQQTEQNAANVEADMPEDDSPMSQKQTEESAVG